MFISGEVKRYGVLSSICMQSIRINIASTISCKIHQIRFSFIDKVILRIIILNLEV